MGNFIPHKEIIKNNINNFLNQASKDYSKFLESPPTFVTYYNRYTIGSTVDPGLENVIEIVGIESPVRYNKISDLAIYGISQVTIQNIVEEFGLNSDFESECTVLPRTIRPYVDDYFSIPYNGSNVLFKITDVQIDRLNGDQYFKLQFHLSHDTVQEIENQINEKYEMLYGNLGTNEKVVIKEVSVRLINQIDKIKDKLIKFYDRNFRHKRFNIIYYKYNDKNIYSSFISKFIYSEKVLDQKNNYLSSIMIQDIFDMTPEFYNLYEKTIYYAVSNQTKKYLTNENFYLSKIINRNMPFTGSYEKFYQTVYDLENNLLGTEVIKPHNDLLINKINSNLLFNDNEHIFEDIIIKYVNSNLNLTEEFLNQLEEIDYIISIENFLLIPCILFILNVYKKELSK